MADEYINKVEVGAKIQMMYIRREMDYGGENDFCRGMRKALRVIENMPTADVQPTDRWISVEDRLPVIDEQVMVYIRNPDDRHNNIELAYLSDESDDEFPYWVFDDNSRFYSTRFRYVTHWQPLPEPPRATE